MNTRELYKLIYSTKSKKVGLDVDYSILVQDDYIYLIFRGTNSDQDIIVDIDFPAKVYKKQQGDFRVHSGFAKAWKSANDIIMKDFILTRKKLPNLKVKIVGHSLGGAMAILAAEDYFFRTAEKVEVVTFGCPKVVFGSNSKTYFTSCLKDIKQYEVQNDPIPKLPPLFSHLNSIKVGDKLNLLNMLSKAKTYHCSYGTVEY